MYLVTCLFLSLILVVIESSKPRSVNLALETVLEFGNKDNSGDVLIIDKVQKFLDKVKTVIDRNQVARRNLEPKNDITFTDFVEKVLNVLTDYENDDLEDTFAVIDDELRKYHYKGCKFYELVENHNVRRLMADQLEYLKNRPAKSIRRSLKYISRELNNKSNKKLRDFLNYVNSFYTTKDSKGKLLRFIDNLELYKGKSKRANLDLLNIVRDGIRSVIFDHYSDLNVNARRDLKIKLETFWKNSRNPKKVEHNIWQVKYTRLDKNKQTTNLINDLEIRSLTGKDKTFIDYNKQNEESDESHHKRKKYEEFTTYDHTIAKRIHINKTRDLIIKRNKLRNPTKSISSFITLYPEEFLYETKKSHFKVEPTTERYKLQTVWKEKIKKSYLNVRERKPVTKIIWDNDSGINVQINEKSQENNEKVRKRYRSRTKDVKKHRYEHKVTNKHIKKRHKTSKTMYSQETKRKAKKILKSINNPASNEGMAIEVFENDHSSLRKSNDNDSMRVTPRNIYQNILNRFMEMVEQIKTIDSIVNVTNITKNINNTVHIETPEKVATSKSIVNNTESVKISKSLSVTNTKAINVLKSENITKPNSTVYNNYNQTTRTPKNWFDMALRSFDLKPSGINDSKSRNETNNTLNYIEIRHVTTGSNANLSAPSNEINNSVFTENEVLGKELEEIFNKYKSNKTTTTTSAFDVNKFTIDSSISKLENENKKQLLHDKMVEDFKMLFQNSSTSVASTTLALDFNDPFQDIESVIDLMHNTNK